MDSPKTLHQGRNEIVWGVDVSTKAISIAYVALDGKGLGVTTIRWPDWLSGGERLSTAYDTIYARARELACTQPAIFVFVEQPSGSFNKLPLTYMTGVIQAAIWKALLDHWKRPVSVQTVPSGTWKKSVCGHGGFGKKGHTIDTYPAMIAARELGYRGDDWDEADAFCIAEHTRLDVRLSSA